MHHHGRRRCRMSPRFYIIDYLQQAAYSRTRTDLLTTFWPADTFNFRRLSLVMCLTNGVLVNRYLRQQKALLKWRLWSQLIFLHILRVFSCASSSLSRHQISPEKFKIEVVTASLRRFQVLECHLDNFWHHRCGWIRSFLVTIVTLIQVSLRWNISTCWYRSI